MPDLLRLHVQHWPNVRFSPPKKPIAETESCVGPLLAMGADPGFTRNRTSKRNATGGGNANAHDPFGSLAAISSPDLGSANQIVCERYPFNYNRSAAAAGLRATPLPRRRLHLDTRLLGLRGLRVLLGARHVGVSARTRFALDSGLLGLGR